MFLYKHQLFGFIAAVTKIHVELPTYTAKSKKGCLTSFLVIVNFLLKRFVTNDSVAAVEADTRGFKQSSLMGAFISNKYAQRH